MSIDQLHISPNFRRDHINSFPNITQIPATGTVTRRTFAADFGSNLCRLEIYSVALQIKYTRKIKPLFALIEEQSKGV